MSFDLLFSTLQENNENWIKMTTLFLDFLIVK